MLTKSFSLKRRSPGFSLKRRSSGLTLKEELVRKSAEVAGPRRGYRLVHEGLPVAAFGEERPSQRTCWSTQANSSPMKSPPPPSFLPSLFPFNALDDPGRAKGGAISSCLLVYYQTSLAAGLPRGAHNAALRAKPIPLALLPPPPLAAKKIQPKKGRRAE